MLSITSKSYEVLSKDIIVGKVENGIYSSVDRDREPLFFKHSKDFEEWLSERCMEKTRTNSRLIARIIDSVGLTSAETALKVHAAKITDTFWVRETESSLHYSNVEFHTDDLAKTALLGDSDGFRFRKNHSPEVTNTGSLEKCWMKSGNDWYLLKKESFKEAFSEIFTSQLAGELHISSATYRYNDHYKAVECKDFTENGKVNLEEAADFIGDDYTDFEKNYNYFSGIDPEMGEDYRKLLFLDAICMNYDRHSHNYGLLRDPDTGEILKLAPNYDNNLSLCVNSVYDRKEISEGFLQDYREFFSKHPLSDPPSIDKIRKAVQIAYENTASQFSINEIPFAEIDLLEHFVTANAEKLEICPEREFEYSFER